MSWWVRGIGGGVVCGGKGREEVVRGISMIPSCCQDHRAGAV